MNKSTDIRIDSSIGELAGILYGEPDKPVILALHGWLDNAESFARLAPLLKHYSVLALDLPGHGRSAWLGAGATYLIWSYVLPILEAIENEPLLNQQPFYLLGHSLGTGVTMLIASALPEKVKAYVALDSLGPMTTPAHLAAKQLRQSFLAQEKPSSSYSNVEQALAVRLRSNRGIPEDALLRIVERNLSQQEGQWQWCTDPRLRLPSAVRLTEEQLDSVMQSLSMPVMAVRAESGVTSSELFKQRLQKIPNAHFVSIEGGHHFHLEPDSVARLARTINDFFSDD